MSRKRQFSSQRYQLSKSNLSHSRNNLNLSRNNLNSSRNNNTPIEKYQIATPQSKKNASNQSNSSNNKPSDLKLSRKSSSSDYICVGCFNDKLASDKKQRIRDELLRQKQQQKINNKELIEHKHSQQVKYSTIQREMNQVKTFNKQLIDHKKEQKVKQKYLQQELNAQQRQQKQRQERQERIKQQQKQQIIKKYNTVIKQQIQQKQQKTHQISSFQIQDNVNDIWGQPEEDHFRQKAQKQHLYRQQLLRQIKDREQKIKKQSAQRHNTQNVGLGLTQAAYQRQLQRQKKLTDRQQQINAETKIIKKQQQRELNQQRLNQQHLLQQRIQQQRAQQEEEKRFRQQKEKKTDAYLDELKHEIQARKRKLVQEQRQSQHFINSSIEFEEKQPQRKSCKSCDKKYPKTFLTKIS